MAYFFIFDAKIMDKIIILSKNIIWDCKKYYSVIYFFLKKYIINRIDETM